MQGQVVVMTGATSGIGQVAAVRLAEAGARIVLVARDRARAALTLSVLRSKGAGAEHRAIFADLSLVSEMRRAAAEIVAQEPRVDVLINNAGALFWSRSVTGDGIERTFAINHVAYFVMALGLEPALRAAPAGRVVNTASAAHLGKRLDLADLQSERRYQGFQVYGRSKLCNILFTRELARRWSGSGLAVNCLHPGFVATRFGDQSGGFGALGVRLAKWFAISPERGAQTIIYLASSPDVAGVSGEYFFECHPETPSSAARDDASAAQLWEATEQLIAANGGGLSAGPAPKRRRSPSKRA
jgi:NAD(P)-dependent dehydrogenase (short-subunit alcohol dehydrogenase family)